MSEGLDIGGFLHYDEGTGIKRFDMRKFRKRGEAWIWLSKATAPTVAYPKWSHAFIVHGVRKDDDGVEVKCLRFPRYVSPEARVVNEQQHFRDDNDAMRVPPLKDPFLLLREVLRRRVRSGELDASAVVFEWKNPSDGELIEWHAGHLSRLEDRTKKTWGHSLDTKLEWIFVIVDNEDPEAGPQIVTVPKLLGDCMRATIKAEMDSNGVEDGNPFINPYCFKWVFDENAKKMTDMYTAHRYNKAKLTDEVLEAIESTDYADPAPMIVPSAGDKDRIRAAMEAAAQIDLPWDEIFVDAWEDDATEFDPAKMDAEKPPQKSNAAGGRSRRKKKEPEADKGYDPVPCDECRYPMHPQWPHCPSCGTEYEIDGDPIDPPRSLEELKQKRAQGEKPDATPKGGAKGKKEPENTAQQCWSCGADIADGADHCDNCGIDLGFESFDA